MPALKDCEHCGETIKKRDRKSWTQYQKRKYCSRSCSAKSQSEKVEVECLNCGQTMKRSPSHVRDKTYCDKGCRKEYNRVTCKCDECGVEFERVKSAMIDRRSGGTYDGTYCSQECVGKSKRKDNGVDQNRRSPEDLKWKKAVIERDDHTCQICGSTENLEAHHIKPIEERPDLRHDPDNGMCVCHDCHYYRIHGGSPAMNHGRYAKPHPRGPFQLVLAL